MEEETAHSHMGMGSANGEETLLCPTMESLRLKVTLKKEKGRQDEK